jgi:hypothetical protein
MLIRNVKIFFHAILPNTRKSTAVFLCPHTSTVSPSDKRSMNMQMGVQDWWNGTDRGKEKYWDGNII